MFPAHAGKRPSATTQRRAALLSHLLVESPAKPGELPQDYVRRVVRRAETIENEARRAKRSAAKDARKRNHRR